MLLLKGCPRCRGDLFVVRYHNLHTLNCLQCGHVRSLRLSARRPHAAPLPSIARRPHRRTV